VNIEGLSLDQLRVVIAVVDTGSFSAAAQQIRRAQSAVSYAIKNAEDYLGVTLFERNGRRPVLTPAGAALIEAIRSTVGQADELQAQARVIAAGVEPEVTLVVDSFYPMRTLTDLLRCFSEHFPSVAFKLYTESLGMVVERTIQLDALGIIASIGDLPSDMARYALSPVPLIAVAAQTHPLSNIDGTIADWIVRRHHQIVLLDRSRRTEGQDYSVVASRTWRVSDLSVKHSLLLAGQGWGNMPLHMVADDLESRRLVRLNIQGVPGIDELPTYAFHRSARKLGPATAWLLNEVQQGRYNSARHLPAAGERIR